MNRIAVVPSDLNSFVYANANHEGYVVFNNDYVCLFPQHEQGADAVGQPGGADNILVSRPVHFVIVRQPCPARHRRSYIDNMDRVDLRALFDRILAEIVPTHQLLEECKANLQFERFMIYKQLMKVPGGTPPAGGSSPTGGSPSTGTAMASMNQLALVGEGSGTSGSEAGDYPLYFGGGASVGSDGSFGSGYSSQTDESYNAVVGLDDGSGLGSSLLSDSEVLSCAGYMDMWSSFYTSLGQTRTWRSMDRSPVNTDEGSSESDENGDDGDRQGKRPRYFGKSDSFRPLKVDGEVQYQIWLMAFVNTGAQSQTFDKWCEITERFMDSRVVRDFVRREVEEGRIGLDITA